MRRASCAVLLLVASCGRPSSPIDGETPAVEASECVFDDVAFDPHGGLVLQAANDVACVRLERAPLAALRRGTEWQAVALHAIVGGDALLLGDELQYANSHHNCLDVVTAGEVTLTIDGANANPDVCFSGAAEEWRVILSLRSGNGATHVLAPHVPR